MHVARIEGNAVLFERLRRLRLRGAGLLLLQPGPGLTLQLHQLLEVRREELLQLDPRLCHTVRKPVYQLLDQRVLVLCRKIRQHRLNHLRYTSLSSHITAIVVILFQHGLLITSPPI